MGKVDFDFKQLEAIPDPYAGATPHGASAELAPGGTSRRALRGKQLGALVAVLLVEISWVVLAGLAPRPGFSVWSYLGAFVVPFGAALLAAAAAMSPGRLGLGFRVERLIALLGLLIGLFGASALVSTQGTGGFTVSSTIACALTSTMLASLPFGAMFVLFRRRLTGIAWLRMALFGAASGTLGAVLVRLHCSRDSLTHFLLGHGAAIWMFGLLGAWVASRRMRI